MTRDEVIDVFRRLNQERGTTIVIVTHDPAVARGTHRRVMLKDGKIVDDHPVEDPITEDLREFAHSELGRQIAKGDASALEQLGLLHEGRLGLGALQQRLAQLQ